MIKLTSINVTVNVKDMDVSIQFYQLIGFTLKQRWGNHYAQLLGPDCTVALHPTQNLSGTSGNISIGLKAQDFNGARQLLEDNGLNVVHRIEKGGAFLHFEDPDGNKFYFIESN